MGRHIATSIIALAVCGSALAELQNVSVGGQIRIRARYWDNVYLDGTRETRIPDFFLPGRPIGPFGAASRYSYDDEGRDRAWVEQNTRLKFSADFTNYVNGVIEVDDFEIWGRGDFRSDYLTGVDSRSNSSDDVEILQSYIETNETGGFPLRLRIGRQQLKLGSGWLVGENQASLELSFDGVRATYTGEGFAIDGWVTKLAESGASEDDGDVDFYGLNATYTGLEGHEFLAYWLFIRDARSLNDTNFAAPIEWLEDAFSLDDYDSTNLHTVGLRASGAFAQFDYTGEIAYQFGEADSIGALFAPVNQLYGDDGATFDNWGGDLEIGYTFENIAWTPRIYLGGVYFSGEDNRDLSFLEWLNPFDQPNASVSFNRLFSSKRYYEFFDEARNGTNFHQIRAGASANPTESITISTEVAKLGANDTFDSPLAIDAGRFRIPVAPALAFLTEESGDDIGIVAGIEILYQYSPNLTFKLSWDHLFTSDDIDEGNFLFANGLEFLGGSDDDDLNYVEFETRLRF
jgi:hypothetical protein